MNMESKPDNISWTSWMERTGIGDRAARQESQDWIVLSTTITIITKRSSRSSSSSSSSRTEWEEEVRKLHSFGREKSFIARGNAQRDRESRFSREVNGIIAIFLLHNVRLESSFRKYHLIQLQTRSNETVSEHAVDVDLVDLSMSH